MPETTLHKADTYLLTMIVALGRAAKSCAESGAEQIELAGERGTRSKGYNLYKEAAKRLAANDSILFHALGERSKEMIRQRFSHDYCMGAAESFWNFLVMDDEGRAEAEDAINAAHAKYQQRKEASPEAVAASRLQAQSKKTLWIAILAQARAVSTWQFFLPLLAHSLPL